jgi:hypothetical protein
MRRERHKPPPARPRLLERIGLAMSTSRRFDRLWIGSFERSTVQLSRVEDALALIKQYSPLDYARIIRQLERIWVAVGPPEVAHYERSLNACVLNQRFVADPATTVEKLAAVIVHEATHARLARCGIEYKLEQRTRHEAVCGRRELAFVARLPNSAELQRTIAYSMEWCRANPGKFSDAQLRENHIVGGIEALRSYEVPEWLIRAMLMETSIFDRARKAFPKAAWAIWVLSMVVMVLTLIVFALTFALTNAFAALHEKAFSKSKPPE